MAGVSSATQRVSAPPVCFQSTLLTLDSSLDGDYDVYMAKLRNWTWDDAMTARGYEQIMELLSLLEDKEADENIHILVLGLTAHSDEAIKHVSHAEGSNENVSIVRMMIQTARTMFSSMLYTQLRPK